MTSYACTNPGCPTRTPITADVAPICYTCARPMAKTTPVRSGWGESLLTAVYKDIHRVALDAVDRGARALTVPEVARQLGVPIDLVPANRTTNSETRLERAMRGSAAPVAEAVASVTGVSMSCLVEYGHGEIEFFVDGGETESIARAIYDNSPCGLILRGSEACDVDGSTIRFSRGATRATCVPLTGERMTACGVGWPVRGTTGRRPTA